MESLDVATANRVAAGLHVRQKRVVNGLGKLMTDTPDATATATDATGTTAPAQPHISEQPWTAANWHRHVNWLNTLLVVVLPGLGWLACLSGCVPLHRRTAAFALLYYALGGVSVTAGYHRLWSHRSYSARWPLRLFLALFGAASVQGSVRWWGHSHRIHHRYTDTPRDPYDARQGLWYSHMGWMLVKPNPKYRARADIHDLNDDWVVRLQHRHYLPIMLLFAFVVPSLCCHYLFGDWRGGLLYAGVLRVFAIQQATFCINSMAHYLGTQPFDDRRTPRDNWLTALVTFGEGYHNFHHEFPSDYRNALRWYQYDPTKVFIYAASVVGLAYDLKRFSAVAIRQALVQQQEKRVDARRRALAWGPRLTELPVWTREQFVAACGGSEGRNLIVVGGIVHDVGGYIEQHPGGRNLLRAAVGKDATGAFQGGVYAHSNAAQNVLANLRVAVLADGKDAALRFAKRRGERYVEDVTTF